MAEATPTPTPPPAAAAAPPAPGQAQPTSPPATEKQPPWGKPENFDADKAWELIQKLRTEKGADPGLRTEFDALKQTQQAQRDALAAALGLKPEETSDTQKLTEQLSGLQQQVLGSERRALAAEHKVPEALLTATNAEDMRKQAEDLVAFAEGAAYAAATASPPPPFQANPGQGQGGGSLTPEAQAAAEYAKYYDERGNARF